MSSLNIRFWAHMAYLIAQGEETNLEEKAGKRLRDELHKQLDSELNEFLEVVKEEREDYLKTIAA